MKKFDLKYNEETMEIILDGKVVSSWNDEAIQNYPEDLIWCREISGLFLNGVKAGYELAKAESDNEGFGQERDRLNKQINSLTADQQILIKALGIAANQLEGLSIAIKTHGQNIDCQFFIREYLKFAVTAREALDKVAK